MWNYEEKEQEFEKLPVGKMRVRVADAEKMTSKSGKEMIKMTYDVSGTNLKLFDYIVFLPDFPDITNRKLTALFDGLGINRGDFNLSNWKGKSGAVQTKEDEQGYVKLSYFLNKTEADKLDPWKEPSKDGAKQTTTASPEIKDEDLPF